MLYSIFGKVIDKDQNSVVIQTAGIGFKIFVLNDLASLIKIGKKVKLFLFFYPENFELYGFSKISEKIFFEMLNTIPGIGPKVALKVMNLLDIKSIKSAIASQDSRILKEAGISSKVASKIIVELADKIEKEEVKYSQKNFSIQQLKEALRSLGYSKKEIDFVLSRISKSNGKIEDKLKEALKILANYYKR
jgi:Holliday junction DNA helicase RuvA